MSSQLPYFVAMQYYAGILNRSYQVFITDNYLCAARVHGIIAAPFAPGNEWNNPDFYINPALAERYQDINFEASEFCKRDRANFQILRASITRAEHFPNKWGMGTVPYSGRLVVHTLPSRQYEFILLGHQDPAHVQRAILV